MSYYSYLNTPDGRLLSDALSQDDLSTLEQLLAKRPKMVDDLKEEALNSAALKSNMKCLKFLLEYGDSYIAGIDARTDDGVADLLREENADNWSRKRDPRVRALKNYSALYLAVRTDNRNSVETLLNYPGVINYAGFGECTLLHLSARFGHLDVTRILLEKGADPRFTDVNYQLPLHHACLNEHSDIAHLLLKSDMTTLNRQDKDGMTPLMLAVKSQNLAGIRMLLENGAKQELCNRKGRIALHFAAESGNAGVLEFLLQSTDASSVEKWILNIGNFFKPGGSLHSLTSCAIWSENVECLRLLMTYKLPKILLQMPHVERKTHLYSPLTYLFSIYEIYDRRLNAILQVLLEHKMTMIHDFFRQSSFNWPNNYKKLYHPYASIVSSNLTFSRKQYYFDLLDANDVTVDYCLQCYNDNSQPFSCFTDYRKFYYALWEAVQMKDIESMKLMIANSAILEPDLIIAQLIESVFYPQVCDWIMLTCVLPDLYPYLISLKPIYFLKHQRSRPLNHNYPHFSLEEEFSKSTLKQLCRTVIRRQLRDYTLEDNLRNFKRKIMELPLPTELKNYLLFKS